MKKAPAARGRAPGRRPPREAEIAVLANGQTLKVARRGGPRARSGWPEGAAARSRCPPPTSAGSCPTRSWTRCWRRSPTPAAGPTCRRWRDRRRPPARPRSGAGAGRGARGVRLPAGRGLAQGRAGADAAHAGHGARPGREGRRSTPSQPRRRHALPARAARAVRRRPASARWPPTTPARARWSATRASRPTARRRHYVKKVLDRYNGKQER